MIRIYSCSKRIIYERLKPSRQGRYLHGRNHLRGARTGAEIARLAPRPNRLWELSRDSRATGRASLTISTIAGSREAHSRANARASSSNGGASRKDGGIRLGANSGGSPVGARTARPGGIRASHLPRGQAVEEGSGGSAGD